MRISSIALGASVLADPVLGQINAFTWRFSGGVVPEGFNLPQCGSVDIEVLPTDARGRNQTLHPPFTMFAYEPSGPTTNSPLIGSDLTRLKWTVPHAQSKRVLLNVVDSQGNAGGVAPNYFPITASPNTSCIRPSQTSFKMSVPQTTALTCEFVTIDLDGGAKPYTITFVVADASVVTNLTMGPTENQYKWINRAAPGSQLLVVASDANGVYANNSGTIATSGASNVTCEGRESVGGVRDPSSSITSPTATGSGIVGTPNPDSANASTDNTEKRGLAKGAIAGIATGVSILAIGVVVLIFFLVKRRSKRADKKESTTPYPYSESNGRERSSLPMSKSEQSRILSETQNEASSSGSRPPQHIIPASSDQFTNSVDSPNSRQTASNASGIENGHSAPASSSGASAGIVQHRDGGPVVEVPPAYPGPGRS